MREIPDSFDPSVVAEIDRRLASVAQSQLVSIPWAIESGSRAWGFPSPDSDYDCRFFYIRSEDDYLSPWPDRDVIETPLDKIYDVNGWDLRKAVQLVVKGNAVVVEWLRSPFIYTGSDGLRSEFLALAHQVADRNAIGRHYTHVALRQWDRYFSLDEVALKRLFYGLRPAATVRWLERNSDSAVPPMELMTLLEEGDASHEVIGLVRELIAIKSSTREMGVGSIAPVLRTYVEEALTLGQSLFTIQERRDRGQMREHATEFFREAIRTYGP